MPSPYKNLFLRQSYLDSYTEYEHSLCQEDYPCWHYILLTASNESQAEAYRQQLAYRQRAGRLPSATHFAVLADPDGKRVGSGGATLQALRYIRQRETSFDGLRILVIHSGGDSKRVPQYSACGKLFSPVPRMLPDGRRSSLFDEFLIGMSGVPARLGAGGMLTLSGDVLLLFNPLQLDFYGTGAAALSIKESAQTGKDHGVFLRDAQGNVGQFLHKQSLQTLAEAGAIDGAGNVNIDTGAVIFGSAVLEALYGLVRTEEGFARYVNDKVRLSFYGDFLYPLAAQSTLEAFYREKPEGEFTPQLREARTRLWELLHPHRMKLMCFSPGSFLHFGTSRELLSLVTEQMEGFRFLDWSPRVHTNAKAPHFAASNSYVSKSAQVGAGSYIEDSNIHAGSHVGAGSIVSGVTLRGQSVPDGTVLHGLKLKDGRFVARLYGVDDNPKEAAWMGQPLDGPLWDAPLFCAFPTMDEAVEATLAGRRGDFSLRSSFEAADAAGILAWQEKMDDKVKVEKFLEAIDDGVPVAELLQFRLSPRILRRLRLAAEDSSFSRKIRIYYYLSKVGGDPALEGLCFSQIRDMIFAASVSGDPYDPAARIVCDQVTERLPVRVNWGGGWSDTPPYCNEQGGTVLNVAVTLQGRLPIEVTVRRLDARQVVLASADNGSYQEFTQLAPLLDCRNPHDAFALHKAALLACGVLPQDASQSLEDVLNRLGGGVYLSTQVIDIPRGSGLGTSSILAGGCAKALFRFLGIPADDNAIYTRVLCMEQLMSTGGGWQDQVGGLTPGIKMVTAKPGLLQNIHWEPVRLSDAALEELSRRFALIYTGQRRLARNLLREVVGKYIGSDPAALRVLYEIQRLAVLMRFELERGNIDGFAQLLCEHWERSQELDAGCTNTCINQIFHTIDDLIDGRMICGAGGGGFLQVILKRGVTRDDLRGRLQEVFADSGVGVWDCEFLMEPFPAAE